jgi:vesicular inhibitory amino acid transporter
MSRNPTNWDEYQYGTGRGSHRSSISSAAGRSIRFSDQVGSPSAASALLDVPGDGTPDENASREGNMRRRRQVEHSSAHIFF